MSASAPEPFDIPTRRSFPWRRQAGGEPPAFPVTPMLDMSFQLLAFFLLMQVFSGQETRIDLVLPTEPAALRALEPAGSPSLEPPPVAVEPETDGAAYADIQVEATADESGTLAALWLAGADVRSPESLTTRLRRYRRLLGGRILRVRLVADDHLYHAELARLLSAIHGAGISRVRLAGRTEPPASAAP